MKIKSPFNDNFETNPDKKYIGGEYSTFDPELSKLSKQVQAGKASHTKLYMAARKQVDKNKAKKFNQYIQSLFETVVYEKGMYDKLADWDNISTSQKENLGQQVIDKVIKLLGTDYGIGKIWVKYSTNVKVADFGNRTISVNFSHTTLSDPGCYIEILRHEFTHAIDEITPQNSPLGAQISHISQENYSYKPKLNKMNPSEINAYGEYKKFGR